MILANGMQCDIGIELFNSKYVLYTEKYGTFFPVFKNLKKKKFQLPCLEND